MNWGRAKTILIILFLVIDVFLFALLSYVQNDVSFIKHKTIEETVSVLKSHNINVKEEQIPSERNKYVNVKIQNLLSDPKYMAERFIGETYSIVSEDEEKKTYQNNEILLTVSNDEFMFQTQRNVKEIESYEETKTALFKDLNKLGYDVRNIGFKNYYIKDGKCYISAFFKFKENRIQDSDFLVVADGNGILNISGKCFLITEFKNTKENLLDITSVLINMIYDSRYHGITIEKAELAYRIDFELQNASEASLYPVYIITDDLGREYVFEAL